MVDDAAKTETIWPLRTWVLTGLGAVLALACEQLSNPGTFDQEWQRRLIAALPVFLGVAGIGFGLAWRRGRLASASIVALLCGLLAGGVFLWNGAPNGGNVDSGWRVACGLLAAAALLTLFQAAQDRIVLSGAPATPQGIAPSALCAWKREVIHYADVHSHLWTNALLLAASALFALLCFGVAHLLAGMFMLVKLAFLQDALRDSDVVALLCGGAFGAALGLLQDRGAIISALQRVAMLVLRVLAPVYALGVGVFLAALPVTGLAPLWETGGTTPLMLAGAMLALLLANAVVGDTAQDESRSTVLSASAAALSVFLLPMVGIAVYSAGLRIDQHGLSPDRLWALAFLIVASITAIAYVVAVLGPRGWFARLRRSNLSLVFLIASVAILLSTPIFGFERIATAHQLARLAGGKVSAEAFDYKALWFDYGPAGRAAIDRLATRSSDPVIRRNAAETRKLANRWDDAPNVARVEGGAALDERLTILPAKLPLDAGMRARLIQYDLCARDRVCVLRYVPGDDFAIVVSRPQAECAGCETWVRGLRLEKGAWSSDITYLAMGEKAVALEAAVRAGAVEVRPVERRQLFIGGEAVGDPLPLENGVVPKASDAP